MRRVVRSCLAPFAQTPFHPQWLVRSRRVVRSRLRTLSPGVVLDVGSADRWASLELSDECSYIALDHPAVVGGAYDSRPDVFGDAAALPLRNGCVDTVLLLEVLEHLPDPAGALNEIARVLRPGGALVLSVPFIYPVHDAPHDYQRYTEHGLQRILEAAGFHVIELSASPTSIETAGLLTNLALAGSAWRLVERNRFWLIALPLIAILIMLVNIVAWTGARLLPSWRAIAAGYDAYATLR